MAAAESARSIRRDASRPVLVLGAGPAGLSAACALSDHSPLPVVVEKNAIVGGLAKTYRFHESGLQFRTDHGPHRFYSKSPVLHRFVENLLRDDWMTVRRRTRQWIDGKYYDYPVNAPRALANLGFRKSAIIVRDYWRAQIDYRLFRKPVRTFEDYIVSRFGKSLGEFNMINYTEKIWGVPASTIHPDWAKQRVRGLSLGSIAADAIAGLLMRKNGNTRTLTDTFCYPKYGSGEIYRTILRDLLGRGVPVHTSTRATSIRHEKRRITEVVLEHEAAESVMRPSHVVESIPITEFLALLRPLPPAEVMKAAAKLRFRSHRCLFVTLDRERVFHDQWIYFPGKEVPFGRISEMKNFSAAMSPADKTSLLIEYFCFEDDPYWTASNEVLLDLSLEHLEAIGFIRRAEVRNCYSLRARHAYPVYDLEYDHYLARIKTYLDEFKNLFYIGRPGRFRYTNQDHSLLMGFRAAQSIRDGCRYEIEDVGLERDFYETGLSRRA